jgi:hypothetical protein
MAGRRESRATNGKQCASSNPIKYIAALLVAGGVYAMIAHKTPVKPAAPAADASQPGTDFLKAPLDRTHQVLDQAHARAQDPALQ